MSEKIGLLSNKTILVGVTGSIAAYKTPNLVSALIKLGANVNVVMTQNACKFITPLVFETLTGRRCQVDTFDRNFSFEVEHISLATSADLCIIAPASANIIAKMAHGICDDMLSTTVLACKCPILVSPAMNTNMYKAKVTQDNIKRLEELGMDIITPASGILACGDTGAGKMPEPEVLLEHILLEIGREKFLKGKKILVTAGPTREAIDPVRFITNHSTGKMGYSIAKQAAMAGADVTLVSGHTALKAPLGVKTIVVESAEEMLNEIKLLFNNQDIIIKSAAVADYRPKNVASEKIKKKDNEAASIELERTTDILKYLGENKGNKFLCGFSMETENLVENTRKKLKSKNLDMIVGNNLKVEGAGFETDTNIVTVITKDDVKEMPLMSKDDVAYLILKQIAKQIS